MGYEASELLVERDSGTPAGSEAAERGHDDQDCRTLHHGRVGLARVAITGAAVVSDAPRRYRPNCSASSRYQTSFF
jgi:hypothetical protein